MKKIPDFDNFLAMLGSTPQKKPVLFELFLNDPLYMRLADRKPSDDSDIEWLKIVVDAFKNGGYDYATTLASTFNFEIGHRTTEQTISANEGGVITDRASYEAYKWLDPENCDCSKLEKIKNYLPDGMKIMVMGPGGVLENVMALIGFDTLCYMIYEDEDLVHEIFRQVGSRLVKYYEIASSFDSVGLIASNDDWGFNTQTFLSLSDMRKFVFPWHKKIAQTAHNAGKPAILHSCGYPADIMDDIIDDMKFDGKHSFEDNIIPIEESYKRWGSRIALLGGMDVDFLIRSTPEEITKRAEKMLELTSGKGHYALGSGNSIPEYIPYESYYAMIRPVLEYYGN